MNELSPDNQPVLLILTTNSHDAQYIINIFNLISMPTKIFKCYQNNSQTIWLIIANINEVAKATEHLYEISGAKKYATFLYLGRKMGNKIGKLVGINKIIDQITFYLTTVFFPQELLQSELITHDKCTEISDKEVSSFIKSALFLITKDQIACLKLIINHENSAIEQLQQYTPIIELIVKKLLNCSLQLAKLNLDPRYYHDFLHKWHFTNYQRHQLKEILRRWQLILPKHDPQIICNYCRNSTDILQKLTQHLENASYNSEIRVSAPEKFN